MTSHDDATQLAELARALPALDLDATSADRIALRARGSVGKGPPLRRLVLPVVGAAVSAAYLAWTVIKLIEVLR